MKLKLLLLILIMNKFLQIKYQQITDLTNKLYKKLCDKEKILNEKADYLKGKLGNINSSNHTY